MPYYLTTAIDYVNSRPHLGTAYEKVTADVVARFHRARGEEVLFLMGNDEHSAKVAQAAAEKGLSPLEHCDEMERVFKEVWASLHVAQDDFIRTTEPRHQRAVEEIVRRIHAKGDLYEGSYEGWYCVGCEAYKNEGDLVEKRCPDHPHLEPQWLEEKNWFFRLSSYTERLQAHYDAHPGFLEPETRRNEILALLRRGLEDISVSRSGQDWGVPFPFDADSRVYVWFDALVNYVAGAGFPDDPERLAKWWPADLHVIGKDITRFHCVIWPAMLMAAELPLPKKVFGHGFVNLGGDRMSKSAGRAADPRELAESFGADTLRYFLCAEAAYGSDLEFSLERLAARANADLANGFGNLASRTLAMSARYVGGKVGAPPAESALLKGARAAVARFEAAMLRLDLRQGLKEAMGIVEAANVHIDRTKPFVMAKDPERAAELRGVLSELAHALLVATRLLHPFMPERTGRLHEALTGAPLDPSSAVREAAEASIPADHVLEKSAPLFPRVETKET